MAFPVTDRAFRYRAKAAIPEHEVRCAFCGRPAEHSDSKRPVIEVAHVDGHEENVEPRNLSYTCRSCNVTVANVLRNAGLGRATRQYNPSGGAKSLGQWLTAVTSMKGESNAMPVDEAVEIIRATPHAKRSEFAREIWAKRKSRGNPAKKRNLFGFGSSRKPEAPKAKRCRSPLTLPQAVRAARQAGAKGDLNFSAWLEAKHLEDRGEPIIRRLGEAWRQGIDDAEAAEREKSEAQREKEEARMAPKEKGTYRGYKIYRTADGEYYSSLDRSSRFDSFAGIKKHIDWFKDGRSNPSKNPVAFYAVESRKTGYIPAKFPTRQEAELKASELNKKVSRDDYRVVQYDRNPAKFDRCVKAVKAKGGAANAYAVCTATGTRKPTNPALYDYFVDGPNGREYFKDMREANARAQALADESVDSIARHDSRGGKSLIFPRTRKNPPTRFYRDLDSKGRERFWHDQNAGRRMVMYPVQDAKLLIETGKASVVPKVKRNPADAAVEVFEEFHGHEPDELVTVTKQVHRHAHLAAAGELRRLVVKGIDHERHTITGFRGALLCFNETKNQLFIEGGDQSVNLEDYGISEPHEIETLGKVLDIDYFTRKDHLGDEGGEATYTHEFRTTNENGEHVVVRMTRYPTLIYRVLDEQLEFSGGSYVIRAEGIDK